MRVWYNCNQFNVRRRFLSSDLLRNRVFCFSKEDTKKRPHFPTSLSYWIKCVRVKCSELILLICGVGEDSWESLGLQGDPNSPSQRRSVLGVNWKDWCWSWNSNTLATWSEELTHLKSPWCWERLKGRGEGDSRGWDGWMASPTRWAWVWASSGGCWWTGKPGVLQSMGLQRVRQNWATELNWTDMEKHQHQYLMIGLEASFPNLLLPSKGW